jgi:hypothetical protein
MKAILLRWDDRDAAELEHELSCFVTFIRPIYEDGDRRQRRSHGGQQFPAFRRIVGVAG